MTNPIEVHEVPKGARHLSSKWLCATSKKDEAQMLRASSPNREKRNPFQTPSAWPSRNVCACERSKELRIATGLVATHVT